MSTLVIQQTRPQALLFQILAQASRGRAVFTWANRSRRLLTGRVPAKRERFDQQVVSEFRAKLRLAEDLIGKLGYSLREMQDVPTPESSDLETTTKKAMNQSASIAQLFKRK